MDPDIFFLTRPSGALWDKRFAILGRALFLATHFESEARAVAIHVGFRSDFANALASSGDWQQSLNSFVEKIYARQLGSNLKLLGARVPQIAHLEKTLDNSRQGRNELIHEAGRGFEWRPEDPQDADELWNRVSANVRAVAEGDLVLCVLESTFNGDPLPGADVLATYVDDLVAWVLGDGDVLSEPALAPN